MHVRTLPLLAIICLAITATAEPFAVRNTHPLAQLHGLPEGGYETALLSAGKGRTQLIFHHSNYYVAEENTRERLTFDGTSNHSTWTADVGLTDHWQIGVSLPYVEHQGGRSDRFIDNWHRTFGLSEGGRNQAPRDELLIQYERKDGRGFSHNRSTSGLGDLRLRAARSWRNGDAAIHASLKLPTGDSDKLFGSGATDFASWATFKRADTFFDLPLKTHARLGAIALGKGEVLPRQQRSFAGLGGVTTALQIYKNMQLRTQLDLHTGLYNKSSLTPLSGFTSVLTLGGSIQLAEDWNLTLGVTEDLAVTASPDVGILVQLSTQF